MTPLPPVPGPEVLPHLSVTTARATVKGLRAMAIAMTDAELRVRLDDGDDLVWLKSRPDVEMPGDGVEAYAWGWWS